MRRLDFELNMRNLSEKDFSMVSKILYKANTCDIWAEYELDYILFAKKHSDHIAFHANENEISHTKFVSRDEILDFLEDEVQSGKSSITPWFHLVLQTKLFGWWDYLEQTGEVPPEDSSGKIINYIEGKDAIDPERLDSLKDIKKTLKNPRKGTRAFSTSNRRPGTSDEMENSIPPDFGSFAKNRDDTVDKQELKRQREAERKLKQQAEFYSQLVKDPNDPCASQFGEKDLHKSEGSVQNSGISRASELTKSSIGQKVTLRGRVHNIRAKGGS